MRIDFHTHAFPDALAPRAIPTLAHTGGGLIPRTDGTLSGLIASMDRCGVSHAVLLNIAVKPGQQRHVNDFAASAASDRVFPFGSVHPDAPDVMDEIERIHALGMKGVKLHPEYQGFAADEPRMIPIYKKIASLGLITLFHAGLDIGYMPPHKAAPDALRAILPAFDGAPVVAAHMGGYMQWDGVIEKLCGLPIYFDTSYSFGRIIKPQAQCIVDKHGPEGILFGTDLPWNEADTESRLIDSLDLSLADRDRIYYKNAAALLGVNCPE